mgnify:CR=1 FL=1
MTNVRMNSGENDNQAWWNSLNHGGLMLSPAQIKSLSTEANAILPLNDYAYTKLKTATLAQRDDWTNPPALVLETLWGIVLRKSSDGWLNSPDASWSAESITGRIVKPWRVYSRNGLTLPVFLTEKQERGSAKPLSRNRRFIARVLEWQRKKGLRFALATNGAQWRFIHAGTDYESFTEWDESLWFEEGREGYQIDAFRILFSDLQRLFDLAASAKAGQGELSRDLGERIRRGVELLVAAGGDRFDELAIDDEGRRAVYLAAVRIVMRLIVILFSEARALLPRDNPVYAHSYSLEGLRDQLHRRIGRKDGSLRNGRSAWPRVLSLFRLVYAGSKHAALPMTAYGGGLFEPGKADSEDPTSRALASFEDIASPLSDAEIAQLLDLLCYATYRTRQGRGSIPVKAPVDFSDLSSEYIGILYEGLLDFELRRAEADDAMVFLNAGNQPALPLSRLEAMSDKELETLFKELAKAAKGDAAEEEESDEDTSDESEEAAAEDETPDSAENEAEELLPISLEDADQIPLVDRSIEDLAAERIQGWKLRASLALELKKKKSESDAAFQQRIERASRTVSVREVLPGEWYLVRWGGTRKGSGTFYTPPGLVEPTVRRTLAPLLYDGEGDASYPKLPEAILSLKVADIAMGSGSFLIGALREITDALLKSLYSYKRLSARENGTTCRLADGGEAGIVDDIIPLPQSHDAFEDRLRGRLKRHIVERCLYGVDIDPLAVELARLALWVETMDYELPFTFLDHKLKVGNSIVGCRFSWLGHYPVNAWSREGPDKDHPWTKAYKEFMNENVKGSVCKWLEAEQGQILMYKEYSALRSKVHVEGMAAFAELHALPVWQAEERRRIYQEKIERNASVNALKDQLDLWCALWFWPANKLGDAPLAGNMARPSSEAIEIARTIARKEHFFHWEMEFPDVFIGNADGKTSGFDAILGNPPWDVWKPSSKEFFSNIDPLYRSYGKTQALAKQKDYFASGTTRELEWDYYRDHFKAISNWTALVHNPFGDPKGSKEGKVTLKKGERGDFLHEVWRSARTRAVGYADPAPLFTRQGGGDVNSYKLFVEQVFLHLRSGGRIGYITPGGIYADNGSSELRKMLLERGQWDWLFGFENRDKIFDIHRSFKFCAFVASKGGSTQAVRVSFMNRKLEAWDAGIGDTMTVSQVKTFSPKSGSFLEIRGKRDLEILEKIYGNPNVVLLGDESERGWGIKYGSEYHMTNDAKLFPPIAKWEEKGYRGDEYGHWLKGDWRPYIGSDTNLSKPSDPAQRPEGTVLSQDRAFILNLDTLEDVALPLYQGVMINHFDFATKFYVSGAGNRAQWADQEPGRRIIRPQFLMGQDTYQKANKPKIVFRTISNATNERSLIAAAIPGRPTGNSLGVLDSEVGGLIALAANLSTFVFDYLLRLRMTGTNVNWFIFSELPAVRPEYVSGISRIAEALAVNHISFAPYSNLPPSVWLINPESRANARAELEGRVALLYGLDESDLAYILSDCDHPADKLNQKAFARGLDPRGFWRVDKELSPEERHTVRTLRAFKAIKEGSFGQIATESFDRAEAAERPGVSAVKERELILAHRELISRIRSLGQEEVTETPKAAAKPERADKKGQGLLF